MTARHLQVVPDPTEPLPEWDTTVLTGPDRAAPRGHVGWRPPRWWRLFDLHRAQQEHQPIPWERHPTRATTRLEFRSP